MTEGIDLSLINAALPPCGCTPITSLQDTSSAGKIAANSYEEKIKFELSRHPWKFAKKIGQISRIDPDLEGEPPEPWLNAYTLPTDFVDIVTLRVGGIQIEHAIQGNVLLTKTRDDDVLILEYLWRVPESRFPSWFRGYVIMRLEAMFLRGVGERHREAKARDDAAEDAFRTAALRDAQQRSTIDPTIAGAPRARTSLEARNA